MVLDLENPTGWSVPSALAAADPRVSWSPDGENILVALNENKLAIYTAGSTPLGSLGLAQDEVPPAWQPDGELAAPETIHSAQGAQARLEQSSDLSWQVIYQGTPGTAPQPVVLDTEPTDRLYHLVGFVPGTNLLLGQTYFAGNQAIMQGAQLFTLDVETGERRDLQAMAPLGWQASYAWKPSRQADQPPVLAFTDTGGPQVGLPVVSLLELNKSVPLRPLPEGVAAADLAWDPPAGTLVFAASPLGEVSPPEMAALYALPAIYQFNPQAGSVNALTQPPAGARDGLPTWSADGRWLIYARYFQSGALEIHALQPDKMDDHLIVAGLTAECSYDGPGCAWGFWLAISGK